MEKELIKVNGEVDLNGTKIKVIEGGFGAENKAILFSDVAKKHEVEPKYINKLIGLNIEKYTNNDLIDLCKESFKVHAKNLGLITSNGQKHCYILSERGYIKLVSSMANDNEKKWEVMDEIINNYFKMREVIKNNDRLKADLLLSIYNGGQAGILASKKLSEMEVAEAVEPLNKQIKENKPKVEGYDVFINTDNLLSWDTVAKNLGIGRNTLLKILREHKILQTDKYKYNGRTYAGEHHNVPYQLYMKYFEVKFTTTLNNKRKATTKVTADGQAYILKKLKEWKLIA